MNPALRLIDATDTEPARAELDTADSDRLGLLVAIRNGMIVEALCFAGIVLGCCYAPVVMAWIAQGVEWLAGGAK